MSLQKFAEAALMGVVEGVTEFLPISSTGHLILFSELIGFEGPPGHAFEVVIQLGAILAVCCLYFSKLWSVAQGALKKDASSWRFIIAVIIAFFPAAVLGFLLHDFIKNVLFSPMVVAFALIMGGVVILIVEKFKPPSTIDGIEKFSPAIALKIGCAQCLALIPGVSRSGATIIGALLMGVERKAAAEFSFFLAIPTMVGAATYDLFKNADQFASDDWSQIAFGFITSFIVAWLVIQWFVGFISTRGFSPFAWYRIILGTVILACLQF